MAALNYQTKDEPMCLQHGFFSDNGGCGYLLKPSFLRSDNPSFDPKETVYNKGKRLKVHIISGQHLPKEHDADHDKDIADPYVEVNTFGVDFDCNKHRTPSVRNNGLNPVWDFKFDLNIYCPELCLIKFQVRDDDRHGGSSFLGQASFPFTALQFGYRHIKLKAKDGDYIHGTIFVQVKLEDL
jgi:Ca2+-dependent lipid-binding protein